MFTRCHQVARTPPAFFSLELSRPLRSISTASALSPRSARPIATELPTTPAPITIASNRSPAITRRLYQSRAVDDEAWNNQRFQVYAEMAWSDEHAGYRSQSNWYFIFL